MIADALIYAFSLLAFTLFLLPAFNEDVSNFWRPFLCSFSSRGEVVSFVPAHGVTAVSVRCSGVSAR